MENVMDRLTALCKRRALHGLQQPGVLLTVVVREYLGVDR